VPHHSEEVNVADLRLVVANEAPPLRGLLPVVVAQVELPA
jgi:hypothetical protein